MAKMKYIIPLVLVLAVAGIGAGFSITGMSPAAGTVTMDEFARCLTQKGVVMYGSELCSHCKANKELFGESFKYVNYVECTTQADLCEQSGIRGYPTWFVSGVKHEGEQSIQNLAQLTGCPLPKQP